MLSSSTQQSSAKAPSPSNMPQAPSGFVEAKPNYQPFASLTTSHASSPSLQSGPSLAPSQRAPVSQTSPSPQFPRSDPFAILSSTSPRQPSPNRNVPTSNEVRPQPHSIFNFAPSAPVKESTSEPSAPPQQSNGAAADDDWDFASALPEDNTKLPSVNELILARTPVTIAFKISRPEQGDSIVSILANSSNPTDHVITEYTFQVAVKASPPVYVCASVRLTFRSNRVSRFG